MQWLDRLKSNPYITALVLASDEGVVLQSTRPLRSDDEQIASMIQVFEVLAQTLADAAQYGSADVVHMATSQEHLVLFPLLHSRYYLLLVLERSAPLQLVMVEVQRVLKNIQMGDIEDDRLVIDDTPVLDAAELIEAVQNWLHNRSR